MQLSATCRSPKPSSGGSSVSSTNAPARMLADSLPKPDTPSVCVTPDNLWANEGSLDHLPLPDRLRSGTGASVMFSGGGGRGTASSANAAHTSTRRRTGCMARRGQTGTDLTLSSSKVGYVKMPKYPLGPAPRPWCQGLSSERELFGGWGGGGGGWGVPCPPTSCQRV